MHVLFVSETDMCLLLLKNIQTRNTLNSHECVPRVCLRKAGGHLAACGTLSTCVLFPCGTQAQVRDASFTLMCHQSAKLETSQSATSSSPPPNTHTRTHTCTHTHAHLNSILEMSAVLSKEILRADERRTSSKTGALPPPLNYPSCN